MLLCDLTPLPSVQVLRSICGIWAAAGSRAFATVPQYGPLLVFADRNGYKSISKLESEGATRATKPFGSKMQFCHMATELRAGQESRPPWHKQLAAQNEYYSCDSRR